jgi:hypothetical protein
MTRDEVMKLSDEELRIKAAELAGFRGPQGEILSTWWRGRTAAWDTEGVLRRIPDYPRDIAAAWELVEMMKADGCALDVSVWCEGDVWKSSAVFDQDIRGYAEASTAPLAITRAFILVMTEGK